MWVGYVKINLDGGDKMKMVKWMVKKEEVERWRETRKKSLKSI